MTEGQLFEKIGRLQAAFEEQDAQYTRLLNLLAGVVGGVIAPSRVLVNLTNRTWALSPEGQSPPLPATINGLPECVVGEVKEQAA